MIHISRSLASFTQGWGDITHMASSSPSLTNVLILELFPRNRTGKLLPWIKCYAADLPALRTACNSIKNAGLRIAECHNRIWYAMRRRTLAVRPWAMNSADCTDKCTFIFLRELRFRTWFMWSLSPETHACVGFRKGCTVVTQLKSVPIVFTNNGDIFTPNFNWAQKKFNFQQHTLGVWNEPPANDGLGACSVTTAAELNTEGRRQIQGVPI